MSTSIHLKAFEPNELILSDEESIVVLKFVFDEVDHFVIDSLNITDLVRSFAQGLLVELIDESYAVGFVEALFRTTANPTAGVVKVMKGFGKKALKHWFEHATHVDLQDVKVYDFLKNRLALSFRSDLRTMVAKNGGQGRFIANVAIVGKPEEHALVWGG
ncbi:Uncharacterised protein [BD1-7 clade bacterium]|uniref:Uncharacterized protein n=1 Tax=BD1-7 clade bacterium TaxID=2029982 RepID=A0A5S9PK84_9GAMM|nr:Uncharacterised protein [BD1-7 clade bacterium]